MSSEKPREWWIHSTGNAYTRDVSSKFPVVHVIEYSAYEQAVRERDELRQYFDQIAKLTIPGQNDTADTVLMMLKERDRYREALEYYANADTWDREGVAAHIKRDPKNPMGEYLDYWVDYGWTAKQALKADEGE